MISLVIARLEAEIAELQNRVEGAFEFAEMLRTKTLPQSGVGAHVLPLGFTGRAPDSAAGAFTQGIDEAVAVMLTVRNQSRDAQAILTDLRAFVMRIIEAVAGWAPAASVGVFHLKRAALVSSTAGTFVYQIDFAISDQLRII